MFQIKTIIFLSIKILIIVHQIKCEHTVWASFDEYKVSLNKTYSRKYEEIRGERAYNENLKKILEHNKLYAEGKTSFQLRATNLADMNNRQYLKSYARLEESVVKERNASGKTPNDYIVGNHKLTLMSDNEIPESFDWRDMGYHTSVDNQLGCGACYAYSVTQSVQGQIFKRTGKLIPLSEQQIIDCSISLGNHGCSGGSLRNTLKYLEKYGGLMRRIDYPYMAKQNKCQYVKELSIVNITSWAILPSKDEDAIRMAVAFIGPVAVSINASPITFQLYSHGIYNDPQCSSNTVNHAMLAVGYTPDYWILKNWWGENWGDKGYMKIKRHKNMCGLANYAAYAIV